MPVRLSPIFKLLALGAALLLISSLSVPSLWVIYRAWRLGGEYVGKDSVRLQTRENNCGPASLQMIFDHYGIVATIEEIERSTGMTEKGVTMYALKETAILKGLYADGWRLTMEELLGIRFPALLFVNTDHFVIADSARGEELFLRDPAIGRVRISRWRLSQIWKGETLLFYRE